MSLSAMVDEVLCKLVNIYTFAHLHFRRPFTFMRLFSDPTR